MDFQIQSTIAIQLPDESDNGFVSAKSHVMGIACLPNVLRIFSPVTCQVQMLDQ